MAWYRFFDGNLAPSSPEMQLIMAAKPSARISKSHNFVTLNRYRIFFTASFILIGLTVASENDVEKNWQTSYIS